MIIVPPLLWGCPCPLIALLSTTRVAKFQVIPSQIFLKLNCLNDLAIEPGALQTTNPKCHASCIGDWVSNLRHLPSFDPLRSVCSTISGSLSPAFCFTFTTVSRVSGQPLRMGAHSRYLIVRSILSPSPASRPFLPRTNQTLVGPDSSQGSVRILATLGFIPHVLPR